MLSQVRTLLTAATPLSRRFHVITRRFATAGVAPSTAIPKRQVNIDRELPDPFANKKINRRYFWVYAVGVTVSCAVIFNYEKTSSPIINSVMYCLRRSEMAKEQLGANIRFKSSWPWIWGTLNTVQGNIDVTFDVRGDQGVGTLRLKANRSSKFVPFDIHHFVLDTDGKEQDLTKDPSMDFDL